MKKIAVTQRSDDFHAQVDGDPGMWGCGKTMDEAVGNLVRAWFEKFGLEMVYPVGPKSERAATTYRSTNVRPGDLFCGMD